MSSCGDTDPVWQRCHIAQFVKSGRDKGRRRRQDIANIVPGNSVERGDDSDMIAGDLVLQSSGH